MMAETTVSSRYSIVIPRDIRERAGIRPGQKLRVIAKGRVISLVPLPALDELRGILKGANVDGYREKCDRQ